MRLEDQLFLRIEDFNLLNVLNPLMYGSSIQRLPSHLTIVVISGTLSIYGSYQTKLEPLQFKVRSNPANMHNLHYQNN